MKTKIKLHHSDISKILHWGQLYGLETKKLSRELECPERKEFWHKESKSVERICEDITSQYHEPYDENN
jgi:hypothetical protein